MNGIPKTMDPKETTLSVSGRALGGYAPDGIFNLAQNGEYTTPTKGVQGDTVYLENADESFTLTVMLMPTSNSVSFLDGLARSRRQFPLLINDASEDSPFTASANGCRVLKMADRGRGGSVGTLSYEIYIPSLKVM